MQKQPSDLDNNCREYSKVQRGSGACESPRSKSLVRLDARRLCCKNRSPSECREPRSGSFQEKKDQELKLESFERVEAQCEYEESFNGILFLKPIEKYRIIAETSETSLIIFSSVSSNKYLQYSYGSEDCSDSSENLIHRYQF